MTRMFDLVAVLAIVFALTVTAVAETIVTTHGDGTRLATIDSGTAAATDVGAFGTTQTWAAAIDTDGTLYTTINGFGLATLATVDRTTAAVTPIGPIGTRMIALEIAADGTMYGVGYSDGILYRIDKSTGAGTPVGFTGIFTMMDLAFDSNGTLWATVGNRLWTLDTTTGAATFQTFIIGPVHAMGIMFGVNDTLYATDYVLNSRLFIVDTTTGATTVVGNTGLLRPHGGDIEPDSDGDGIIDREDDCPHSDLRPTVIIDSCDSEVANVLFDSGCTMSDLIQECAEAAANHGAFVSCVSHLTNDWKVAGLITGREKARIVVCAAIADIP